ncbi:G domain-containing protein [Trichostrongylus colubriformis]|uniref:G domain-containing protein n=1 Tax=Trichostrongylus colubriformis TaxID=6319 RepID=A0AAN8J379_TRICO
MRYTLLLRATIKQVQKLISHDLGVVERDTYTVRVCAGSGGHGLSRYDGRGGNGGSVFVMGVPDMAFSDIKKRLGGKLKVKAVSGTSSQKVKLVGDNGEDATTSTSRSPIEVVALLNRELENYDKKLLRKPVVLLFNKIDIAPEGEPEKLVEKMRGMDWPQHVPKQLRPAEPLTFDYVLPVSAKLGDVEEVKKALIRVYKALRPSVVPESTFDDHDGRLL